MLRKVLFQVLALGAAVVSRAESDFNPAARRHVKMDSGVYCKYTSKLKRIVELNFALTGGHLPGKAAISGTLDRIAKNYSAEGDAGAIRVARFQSGHGGSDYGVVPDFTLADLVAGEVIVANNVSNFADSALGKAKQDAIRRAIETEGRGYLGFHASGDGEGNGWPWYADILFPWTFKGRENSIQAPVYKHPREARHSVLQGILESRTVRAIVPDELDADGNEAFTPDSVPTRRIKNEWFKFGRDISREQGFRDKVTILLKYDASILADNQLDPEYKRKGGNIYSHLYKVGAGMTSYMPAGHEEDELDYDTLGFDARTGDLDRYLAQLIFFLAGYDKSPCDSSCDGLTILDSSNHLTERRYGKTAVSDPQGRSRGTAARDIPEVRFHAAGIGFSSSVDSHYHALLTDLHGRIRTQVSGRGSVDHGFAASALPRGIYLLHVRIGSSPPQIRRYALLPDRK